MPVPKFLRCLPCMQDDSMNQQVLNDGDLTTPIGRGFSRRQIAKGVAIVLSGYDSTTAAASIGGGCDPDTVDLWAQMYRPPFFETGMSCPPALILWWIKELDRKDQLALGCIPDPNQQVMMAGGAVNNAGGLNNLTVNPPLMVNPPNPTGQIGGQPNRVRLFYPSGTGQSYNPQAAFQQQQQSGQVMNPSVGQYVPANNQQQVQQQGSNSSVQQYRMAQQTQLSQQQSGRRSSFSS